MDDYVDNTPICDEQFMRVAPHSIEAETVTIGSLILKPAIALGATNIVTADDFYRPAHQVIWTLLLDMLEAGQVIDMVTLKEQLLKAGQLKHVGGIEYIVAMVEGTPSPYNAEYYAKIVREKAVLRTVISQCDKASNEAWSAGADLPDILSTVQGAMYELDHRLNGQQIEGDGLLADAGRSDVQRLVTIQSGQDDPVPPVPTGFRDLDSHMDGGPRPGEMVVLAAGPEMGKSSLALNIAANVCAIKSGFAGRCLFISAEMPKVDLWRRVASARTGIQHRKMRVGDVDADELDMLSRTAKGMRRWRFSVADRALTVQGLGVEARRWAMKWGGLDVVIIDYLQRMKMGSKRETRQVQVGDFSCGVKQLAMDLKVPVLLLCQINREGKKAERPPELFDLRDSGAIEDDADYVLMMHQTQTEIPSVPVSMARGYGRTMVAFRKGRNAGRTAWGTIHLQWRPTIFRFNDDAVVERT